MLAFHVLRSILARLLDGSTPIACSDVGCIPVRPMVLRSGRIECTVVLLGFAQETGQCRDIHFKHDPEGAT
jgi:hypothetical protein